MKLLSELMEIIKANENPNNIGFVEKKGIFLPHPSPEGGPDTIAYGKKLSSKGTVNIDGKEVFAKNGITMDQANSLLTATCTESLREAGMIVDNMFGKGTYEGYSAKQKLLGADKTYQLGHGKAKTFKKFYAAVHKKDWKTALHESKTFYTDPETGEKKLCTDRYNKTKELIEKIDHEMDASAPSRHTAPSNATIDPASALTYRVQSGDTLSDIAKQAGTSVDTLMKLNPQLSDQNIINMGDNINLPKGSTMPAKRQATLVPEAPCGQIVVKGGDTLSAISKRTGVSVDKIAAANNIDNPNLIQEGSSLQIPGGEMALGVQTAAAGGVAVAAELIINPDSRTPKNVAMAAGLTGVAIACPTAAAYVGVQMLAYDVIGDVVKGKPKRAVTKVALAGHQAAMSIGVAGAAANAGTAAVTVLAIANPVVAAVVVGSFIGSALFGLNQFYKLFHREVSKM